MGNTFTLRTADSEAIRRINNHCGAAKDFYSLTLYSIAEMNDLLHQFDREENFLVDLLKKELECFLKQNIEAMKAQRPPNSTGDFLSTKEQLALVSSYCQQIEQVAQRERARIKTKLNNIQRFLSSYVVDFYKSHNDILSEIHQLKYAYIVLFLKAHLLTFQTENQSKLLDQEIVTSFAMLRDRKNNDSSDSATQATRGNEGPSRSTGGGLKARQRQSVINQDLTQLIEKYNYHFTVDEPKIFTLNIRVYYTKYDHISLRFGVYIRPKEPSEETSNSMADSPMKKGRTNLKLKSSSAVSLRSGEPIFLNDLTTDLLFQEAKAELTSSYRGKRYLETNEVEPICLETLSHSTSECIDFFLTKGEQKICDFLHSIVNTNEEGGQKVIRDQIQDEDDRMDFSNNSFAPTPRQMGAQSKILKIQFAFASKKTIEESKKKKQNISQYDFIKTLGEGAFAKVILVRHKGTGNLYAMKAIHKEKIMMTREEGQGVSTAEELAFRNIYRAKQILSERHIFSRLNQDPNPFIVQLHSAFTSKNYLYFILDLCPGGDLFSLIQKHRTFLPKQAKYLFAEVVLAVEHLHKHNILYRDLKPENILVDQWGHLKLTDFGLSKPDFGEDDETRTICGSPEYFCPEILLDQSYGRTLDFYSLGVLLYELVIGLPPFYNTDQFLMQKDIVSKPPRLGQLPADLKSLLEGLLEKNPSLRLGASHGMSEIKEHPFFKDLDWAAVRNMKYKYNKLQFLKLDMTTSNFNTEYVQNGVDNYDVGINIEEEIEEPKKKNRCHQGKLDVKDLYRALSRERSKSFDQDQRKQHRSAFHPDKKRTKHLNSEEKVAFKRQLKDDIARIKGEPRKLSSSQKRASKNRKLKHTTTSPSISVNKTPWVQALQPTEIEEVHENSDSFISQEESFLKQSSDNFDGFSYRKNTDFNQPYMGSFLKERPPVIDHSISDEKQPDSLPHRSRIESSLNAIRGPKVNSFEETFSPGEDKTIFEIVDEEGRNSFEGLEIGKEQISDTKKMMPGSYVIKPKKKLLRGGTQMTSSIRKNSTQIQNKEVNQTEESESFFFDEPETMPPLKATRNSKFLNKKENRRSLEREEGAEVKEILLFRGEAPKNDALNLRHFYSHDVAIPISPHDDCDSLSFHNSKDSMDSSSSSDDATKKEMRRVTDTLLNKIVYQPDMNPDDSLIKKRRGSGGLVGSNRSPLRQKVLHRMSNKLLMNVEMEFDWDKTVEEKLPGTTRLHKISEQSSSSSLDETKRLSLHPFSARKMRTSNRNILNQINTFKETLLIENPQRLTEEGSPTAQDEILMGSKGFDIRRISTKQDQKLMALRLRANDVKQERKRNIPSPKQNLPISTISVQSNFNKLTSPHNLTQGDESIDRKDTRSFVSKQHKIQSSNDPFVKRMTISSSNRGTPSKIKTARPHIHIHSQSQASDHTPSYTRNPVDSTFRSLANGRKSKSKTSKAGVIRGSSQQRKDTQGSQSKLKTFDITKHLGYKPATELRAPSNLSNPSPGLRIVPTRVAVQASHPVKYQRIAPVKKATTKLIKKSTTSKVMTCPKHSCSQTRPEKLSIGRASHSKPLRATVGFAGLDTPSKKKNSQKFNFTKRGNSTSQVSGHPPPHKETLIIKKPKHSNAVRPVTQLSDSKPSSPRDNQVPLTQISLLRPIISKRNHHLSQNMLPAHLAALREGAISIDSKTSQAFLTVEDVDSDMQPPAIQKNLSLIESIQLSKMQCTSGNQSMEMSQAITVSKCERSPKKMQLSSRVSQKTHFSNKPLHPVSKVLS